MDSPAMIISFSGRKNGNCEQICNYIAVQYGKLSEKIFFSDQNIKPCGNCSYECFLRGGNCPQSAADSAEMIFRKICESPCTVFVLPNYNQYPNANFFAFQERCQQFYRNEGQWKRYLAVPKSFVVISNTGTQNFVLALSKHTLHKPQILFLSARKYGLSCINDNILDSEQAKADIRSFICSWFSHDRFVF